MAGSPLPVRVHRREAKTFQLTGEEKQNGTDGHAKDASGDGVGISG